MTSHRTLLAGMIVVIIIAGLTPSAIAQTRETNSADVTEAFTDAPLADYQRELLELAFKAACVLPIEPHIKTRCVLQEYVATACITLNQPNLALSYAQRIDDWRRGAILADLAYYCVRNNLDQALSKQLINQADAIAFNADDWRRDHIRVKIARVHALLGQHQLAQQYAKDTIDAEAGKVDAALAKHASDEEFDARYDAMNVLLESKNFDHMRNGLEIAAILYNRFYDDAERRARIERAVRVSVEHMPIIVRFHAMLEMAKCASAHRDHPNARTFLNQARGYIYAFNWAPEDRVPLHGQLAISLHRAGADEDSQKEIDAGVAHYVAKYDELLVVDRARALLPIAEALHVRGNTEAALNTVARALDEGLANPNIVPRATDLNAVCLMLATSGLEPDETLFARLRHTITNFQSIYEQMQREAKMREQHGQSLVR